MYDGNLPVASKLYPHKYWSLPFLDEDKENNIMENFLAEKIMIGIFYIK